MMLTTWYRKAALIGMAGSLLLLGACSGNKPDPGRPGGGMEDYRQEALYDRDSRNNEDASLGVKKRWTDEQNQRTGPEYAGRTQLDMSNPHLAKTMAFDPRIAERIKQVPGVEQAQVLMTETNAYVAVVLKGHSPDAEANPEMMKNQFTPKGGSGLFASDKGATRINWTEPGGLTTSQAAAISRIVGAAAPTNIQRVYASANPNFVQRVRFYAKEEQERGNLSAYVNEFNTMIQRVFPQDTNTRK